MTTSNTSHRSVISGEGPPTHSSVQNALNILEGPDHLLQQIEAALIAALAGGEEDVDISRARRLLYATDASIYEMEPVAITFPRDTSDVQAIVQVANTFAVPILPRGAGTSLAGQGVNHAIVIDFTRYMNQVLEIDSSLATARVQPGLVVDALNKQAKSHQLMYPVDPSTRNRATIGGGIGNNSCGAHSLRHGKTSDQLISVTVVLNDGSIIHTKNVSGSDLEEKLDGDARESELYRSVREIAQSRQAEIEAYFPKIPRRVSGYNLDTVLTYDDSRGESMDIGQMIVGSEGTLGIVTEATIKLAPLAAKTGIIALHFESIEDACRAAPIAVTHDPAAVELVDRTIIERCRESFSYKSLVEFVIGTPGGLLLVEVDGETEPEVIEKLDALAKDFRSRGLTQDMVVTTNLGEQARMWRMREAGLGLLMSVRGDAKPVAFVEDGAVEPELLGDYVARFEEIVRRYGLPTAYYGHAGAGCLHIRPMINLKELNGPENAEILAQEIADLILEFGGSLSGEHGDGIVRGAFTERMFGPALVDSFRDLKLAFDPDSLMNPGKIIDTPAFNDNLRLSPQTGSLTPPTFLNWDEWGGIARAAEQCNGQGACLKDVGTMCPSFMVTKDEEHSTRGRANLLRQVLNQSLPPEELTGDRIHEAMDLCVECKACKNECPSAVDMALLKSEVLALRHAEHGVPLRDRIFAGIAAGAKLNQLLGMRSLTNYVSRIGIVKAMLDRFIGIHKARPLPEFAQTSFVEWFRKNHSVGRATKNGSVVLFVDTFTNYFQPQVGKAAVMVLEALGYAVLISQQNECCGRPMISKGLLADARNAAAKNLKSLERFIEAGTPIIGLEPSCLLVFRDEYPLLLHNSQALTKLADTAAKQSFLIEEFITQCAAEDEDSVRNIFQGGPDVSIHVHCHEKALVGTEQALKVLELANIPANLIDSACCGMAGSFGFETEHYEISKAMADRTLIPAIREMPELERLLITGTSCRQQLDHFTSKTPIHLVEALAESLTIK